MPAEPTTSAEQAEPTAPAAPAAPPEAALWREAGRGLLARTIGELAYEEMVHPVAEAGSGDGDRARYRLAGESAHYLFTARRGGFGAWHVEPESIVREAAEAAEPAWDPTRFITDTREAVGLPGDALADVVRDMVATHAADARLLAARPGAAELADLAYADLEGHQTGHPCMFLNKGRMGFSASDAARYTPEARGAFRLVWVAAHPGLGRFQAMAGLEHTALVKAELGGAYDHFADTVRQRGGDPDTYVWLPVHPFQWDDVIAPLFAGEIALGRLIRLGESPDRYRPFQSIRTLMNLDRPERHNVKVPLMIRNTLVWRGLSGTQTACAPHTSAWLRDLCANDPFLRDECRVVMLGETASVTVPHPVFDRLPDTPYRFDELLGAIWREPVHPRLAPGERARTMAALLLEGADGRSVCEELIARSGLAPLEWLRRFAHALLPPVLHYLYRYGASFTPHGENVVLVFDADDVPRRIALKDFGSDVELLPFDLAEYAELPEQVRAVLHRWEGGQLAHSVLSAICAGHLRFLADIAHRRLGVAEADFWRLFRAEILTYHRRFPELGERFAWFGLLAPTVGRVALNREQLMSGGFHDRAERDAEFDVLHGEVPNPLARP